MICRVQSVRWVREFEDIKRMNLIFAQKRVKYVYDATNIIINWRHSCDMMIRYILTK